MRITQYNLKKYLKETYGSTTPILQQQKKLDGFTPLLQADYGEASDCTLTSMTAIVNFLSYGNFAIQDVYDYTEKIAKKYGYRGTKGTPFLTIRKIFHEVLKKFKLPKANVKYAKELGYTFKTIQAEINKGNPLILSMNEDGQDYYENHSVTIIGYEYYLISGQKVPMLIIYDNWYKTISYIDYNKLSPVSTIHYSNLTFQQRFQMWRQLKNLK